MNTLDPEKLLAFLTNVEEGLSEGVASLDRELSVRSTATTYALGRLREEILSGRFDYERPSMTRVAKTATAKVRHWDPHTSFSAAMAQTPEKSLRLYKAIKVILTGMGPMTDERMHDVLKNKNFVHTESGLRTRRSELTRAGWVRDSGTKLVTKAGSRTIVWEFAPESESVPIVDRISPAGGIQPV